MALHEAQLAPFDKAYEGTPFHDFVARLLCQAKIARAHGRVSTSLTMPSAGRCALFTLVSAVAFACASAPPTAPASAPRSPAPAPSPANAPGLHDGLRILASIHTGADLDRLCAVTERDLGARGDALLADTQDDARLLEALRAFDRTASVAGGVASVLARAHPAADARQAASKCMTRLDAAVKRVTRGPLIARLSSFHGASPADATYAANIVDEARRAGATLPVDRRQALRALEEKEAALVAEMKEAVATGKKTLRVDPARLRGLPPAFLASHPAESGAVALANEVNDLLPVLRFGDDRALARDLFRLTKNRAYPENEPRLRELLETRHQEARVLDFSSWADLQAAPRMVGRRARTEAFLEEIRGVLAPVNARYRAYLGLHEGDPKPPEADALQLEERARRTLIGLDSARLSEYFELGRTLDTMLAMIGEVYGLRFARTHAPAWSDDVIVFDVTREDGAPVSTLYFDLYARRGKTPGAGSSIPIVGRTFGGDPGATSAIAILTSFEHPSGAIPALLAHDDLIMLLHETGHALHMMLLAGQSELFEREFDFFDVPSQVMEAWAYRPEFLRRVARHYATGAPMPAELEAALVRDQPFRVWYQARRTTVFGNVDVRFHGDAPPEDLTTSYAQSFELAQPYAFDTETHPEASLYIPIVVYSGNGHALVWGEAIAIDLLGQFEEEGFFDRKVWARYIADVLASEKPAEERIAKFLGRRWSTERMRGVVGKLFVAPH